MPNNNPIHNFSEKDLENIRNLEKIKKDKSEIQREINDVYISGQSLKSIKAIQNEQTDIMKMSDEEILAFLEIKL
jgi:hypothetical protein